MGAVFKDTNFAFGGAFPANRGIINSVGGRLSGAMMQNLDVQYAQQFQRIYELGVAGQLTHVFFIGSRPQGSIGVGHIMGPGVAIGKFLEDYGDPCNIDKNHIELDLSGQMCAPSGRKVPVFKMKAGMCVLANMGVSTNTGNLAVQVRTGLEFANLDYNGS